MSRAFVRITSSTVFIVALLVSAGCGAKKIKFSDKEGTASNEADKPCLSARITTMKVKKDRIDLGLLVTNNYKHPIYLGKNSIKLTFNGQVGLPKGESFVRRIVSKSITKESTFLAELGVSDYEHQQLIFSFFPKLDEKSGTGTITIQPIYAEIAKKATDDSSAADKPKAKPKKTALRTKKDDRVQNLDKEDTNGDLMELPPLTLNFKID